MVRKVKYKVYFLEEKICEHGWRSLCSVIVLAGISMRSMKQGWVEELD